MQQDPRITIKLYVPEVVLVRDLLSDIKKMYPNERIIARNIIKELDRVMWCEKTGAKHAGRPWPSPM